MAFEFQHYPEQQFILIRVSGDISLEENREIGLQLVSALENAEASTDILFDLRSMRRFPTSISQLRQTSAVIRSPKLGWMILITGDRPLLKFIATVLIQLQTGSVRMRVFDTLEATIHFLKDLQPTARERSNWLDDLYKAVK